MKRSLLILSALIWSISLAGQNEMARGDMQFEMRAYQDAIASYKTALQNQPDNQALYAGIARAYIQLLDNLQASQWYEKIADREDVVPQYLLEYGHTLKSLRLYAKAKYYYQKYGQHDAATAEHFIMSCDVARAELEGPEFFAVANAGINSGFSEYGPVVFDGNLIFNSFRTDIKTDRRSKDGTHDLAQSNMPFVAGSHGAKPVRPYEQEIKGDQGASHVRFSGNGNWVVFDRNDFRGNQRLFDSRAGKMSIFMAEVDGRGNWENIKPFPHNGNAFASGYPTLSHDGSVMYFASTRPGGYGGWDLYVSFRSKSGWTNPQNLGPAVNTAGNEISPCYVNRTLYFSSDWHAGYGGFDIFKAISHEGQWTGVKHMGYPLNSPKDDLDYFVEDEMSLGFFVSNRIGSQGLYDVWSCEPQFEEITMVVREQSNRNPLTGAIVKYKGSHLPIARTNAQGQAIIHQPFEGERNIIVSKQGFKDLSMTLKHSVDGPSHYEVSIDRQSVATLVEDVSYDAGEAPEDVIVSESKTVNVEEPLAGKQETETPTSNKEAMNTDRSGITVTESPVPEKMEIVQQYAIQVAALGKHSSLRPYQALEKYGTIMQIMEGDYYKVRIGYFEDAAEARNTTDKIKAAGYPDAYIVRRTIERPVGQTNMPEAVPVERAFAEKYMVRLATYSQPGNFSSEKIAHLGEIESYRKNNYTIMLLSGYKTVDAAEAAMIQAAKLGFPDAYVVVDRGGQLQRVHTSVTER